VSEAKGSRLNLTPGAQAALVALGLVLVAAAGFFLLISPKRGEASELDGEITALQGQIAEQRQLSAGEPPEPVEVSDLFRLAKAMPDTTDMSGILLELNRVAGETGIEFNSISPGGATVQGAYQVIPVSLAFEGNFYSLSDFLYRLRSLVQVRDGDLTANGRLFTVDTITFAEGVGSFPNIQASLSVNAFVFGTTPAAAAPPPPPATATTTTPATTTPGSTTPAPTTSPSTPTAPAEATAGAPAGG
jgi:type IV pilus assembly protein PilO